MLNSALTWASSQPAVATVDQAGLAVAVGNGATTISATDAIGAVASTALTVRTRAALSVLFTGAGGGSVASNPAGIQCAVDCSASYDVGTTVTLTATPDSRSTFRAWTGCNAVSGLTCTVTVNAATSVTAAFDLKTFPLTVTRAGLLAVLGTVTADPSGPGCGDGCSTYTIDTVVTLTAEPSLLLTGWTGCDSASGNVCTVTMRNARSVTATFLETP
jgi:hypothetical protein